jgi:alpha-methylacyl-CoA racemase
MHTDPLLGALEGVQVVDLSRLLPGPFASMLLGDLGATVWKVEDPRGGDYARHYQPFVGPMGAFFASINRNKRSVALDLKAPAGAAALRRLLGKADVLLESFRPGVLARLGLDPEALLAAHPGLIICSISGFGQTGAAREVAGHDLTYLARAGLLSGGEIPRFQVADIAGGALYGVAAIMAALLRRGRTGQGGWLDISMTDGALSFLAPTLSLLAAQASPATLGMLSGALPCYQLYPTADGRLLAVAALEPQFWARFCAAAGLEQLATDGLMEGARGEAALDEVRRAVAARPLAWWVERLEGADACCAAVQTPAEAAQDPLFHERGLFFTLEGHGARFAQVATPLTPADRAAFVPPPRVGEHTRAGLCEAGLTEEEIGALLSSGVARQG